MPRSGAQSSGWRIRLLEPANPNPVAFDCTLYGLGLHALRHDLELTSGCLSAGQDRDGRFVPSGWAPNGTHIAFLLFGTPRYRPSGEVAGTDIEPGPNRSVHLGVVSLGDQVVRTLMPLGTLTPAGLPERHPGESRPSWSPDSTRLLVKDMSGNLFVLGLDGSNLRRLGQGTLAAAWSPDGSTIAVTDREKQITYFVQEK